MRFLCRYTIDDYIDAHRLHRKGSLWRRWDRIVGLPLLFIFATGGLLIVLSNPRLYRTALPLLALAVFWALLLFVFPRMRIQYVFKRNPHLNQESTIEVSEDGILNENPNMRSRRNWKMFISWAENNRIFMIYSAPNQFLMLPKRSLAVGEADQLRDLLRRKLPGK
jgi:hypothetical protein